MKAAKAFKKLPEVGFETNSPKVEKVIVRPNEKRVNNKPYQPKNTYTKYNNNGSNSYTKPQYKEKKVFNKPKSKHVPDKLNKLFTKCKNFGILFKIFQRSEEVEFKNYVRLIIDHVDGKLKYYLIDVNEMVTNIKDIKNYNKYEIASVKIYPNFNVRFIFTNKEYILTEQFLSLRKTTEILNKSILGQLEEADDAQ